MGADSWSHWQPWSKSLKATLVAAQAVALEEQGYESVDEALEATEADGTASVIDITGFVEEPEAAHCWELTAEECAEHLGAEKPTRAAIEEKIDGLVEGLGRGESLCVVAWKKEKPEAVYFAGWSFD